MKYKTTALNQDRILNHCDLIKRKMILLNSSAINGGPLFQTGHLELQLTDKCMLNCPNCHFRGLGDNELYFGWIDNIVKFIKPKAITIAGGGEPTIYPHFNEAILKLAKIKNVKIGLITNGVFIPAGLWKKYITWIRISVYSIENGKYAGGKASFYETVINNIQMYLNNKNMNTIGIHFLFYRNNMPDIVPFAKRVFFQFMENKRTLSKIHIQFKPAFILARPTQLTPAIHQENIALLPDYNQVKTILEEFKNEFRSNPDFLIFIKNQSNYQLFRWLAKGYLNKLIEVTDQKKISPNRRNRCYICLAFQLIAPDGSIYPCLTLAEHRLDEFSISHLSESPNRYGISLKKFFKADTECCNKWFCRNWDQNDIVEKYLKEPLEIDISEDYFF